MREGPSQPTQDLHLKAKDTEPHPGLINCWSSLERLCISVQKFRACFTGCEGLKGATAVSGTRV